MKAIKHKIVKKSRKEEREFEILLGLVEYYLDTGKPVGSNTLKEAGFDALSSATIRNYFADLEKQGYLEQLHTSGGRAPTPNAYREYANAFRDWDREYVEFEQLQDLAEENTKAIAAYLQKSADLLSELSGCAVFLSAPRFDHDFITAIKLVPVDMTRFLCVIITDFGVVQTELFNTRHKISAFSIKRIEDYFHWRLTGLDEPENLEKEELATAQELYNEIVVRYIVGYSNFTDEEVYRTGFSKLLNYPELQDVKLLSASLALFENAHSMRLLLRECQSKQNLTYWIEKDLAPFAEGSPDCAVIAAPYQIHRQTVGAVGLLGPTRIPYKKLFALIRRFSETISENLTRNIYKFKIQYRQPAKREAFISREERRLIGQSRLMLLEHKNQEGNDT